MTPFRQMMEKQLERNRVTVNNLKRHERLINELDQIGKIWRDSKKGRNRTLYSESDLSLFLAESDTKKDLAIFYDEVILSIPDVEVTNLDRREDSTYFTCSITDTRPIFGNSYQPQAKVFFYADSICERIESIESYKPQMKVTYKCK